MSSNFTDNTNRFTSSVIPLSLNQSVLPRPGFRENHCVAAQSSPSAGTFILGNALPPHAGPPFDYQIFTTSYEPQQSLAQNFRTDSNHQQLHVAMRGDANQQIPDPSSSTFQANSMLVHPATMGTVHGMGESSLAATYHLGIPVYRHSHTFTGPGMYSLEPRSLFNSVDYSWNSDVGSMQQSPTMAIEGHISANYSLMLASENTNSLTFTTAYGGGTTQGISESDLAAANHLIPVYGGPESDNLARTYNAEHQPLFSGVFVNNMQPSWKVPLMTQQTPHAQADHPGNLTVGTIRQSSTVPTSANHCQVTLAENTNGTNADGKESSRYSLVADGNNVHWRCNIDGCQHVSRFKRDIKRHCSKLKHRGRREHKCEFCGKAFVRKDIVKRHVTATRCWLRQARLTLPKGDLCGKPGDYSTNA